MSIAIYMIILIAAHLLKMYNFSLCRKKIYCRQFQWICYLRSGTKQQKSGQKVPELFFMNLHSF